MDLQPVPFPGRNRPVKSKFNPKMGSKSQKHDPKEPSIPSQRRVFGTTRTNVIAKPETAKAAKKRSGAVPKKQLESSKELPPREKPATENREKPATENRERTAVTSDEDIGMVPKTEESEKNLFSPSKSRQKSNSEAKSSPVETRGVISDVIPNKFTESSKSNRTSEKKGSDFFPKDLQDEGAVTLRTPPASSPSLRNARNKTETPYRSAKQCSKCRFDRLESSSYWLAQIKLAETGGKHSVSAAFFRLALESKAEPIRDIRVELKKYSLRHPYLSEEREWRDVCISYGLQEDEENAAKSSDGNEIGRKNAAD